MGAADAPAQNAMSASIGSAKPTIILVHGAVADALGWQYVIPILEKDGVKASHVAFISQPNTVARFIEQAAMGASK